MSKGLQINHLIFQATQITTLPNLNVKSQLGVKRTQNERLCILKIRVLSTLLFKKSLPNKSIKWRSKKGTPH